jgi:hypothetical protein
MTLPAFEVSKEGLAKILARRGIEFAVLELLQNALDENVRQVHVRLGVAGSRGRYRLMVQDDCAEGFQDLSHAYTLFAESRKTKNPEQRGRFNLGEKLVIAVCDEASITTTTGQVIFEGKHRRSGRERTVQGSVFEGVLKMTRDEYERTCEVIRTVIIPNRRDDATLAIEVSFNGEPLPYRRPVRLAGHVPLPTEIADPEGYLRPTVRQTDVWIHEPLPGRAAMLYELGIPVVETGDRYDVNVMQKIPLNADRDNVTPAYLRQVRTIVLNATHDMLSAEEAKATWVTGALEDPNVAHEAVEQIITARYGEKRVIADPSDPEGTKIAMSQGYTVIPGGALSREAWENVHSSGAARPAGQVTPSPKPFHEGGRPLKVVPEDDWTDEQRSMADFVQRFGAHLLGHYVKVEIANDFGWPFRACFGVGCITLNAARLGGAWFGCAPSDPVVVSLLLHEFAHDAVSDHLSNRFHNEVGRLGAHAVRIALEKPELFERREV